MTRRNATESIRLLPEKSGLQLGGVRVHYLNRECMWGSQGVRLYRFRADGELQGQPLDLAVSFAAKLRSQGRLLRRLLRSGVHHVHPVDASKLVVVVDRFVGCVDLQDPGNTVFSPLVGSRPLHVCVDVSRNTIYYGEYRDNSERGPIRIVVSHDRGASWGTAFEMTGVRHVHGVFADPHSSDLWVTTGDENNESAIWVTTDGFRSLEKVVHGSQQTRAVGLLFTKDHVYFGSDSERESNHLWRLERETLIPEKLCNVEGTVLGAGYACEGLCFSTAVEPSAVNLTRSATIWWSRDGEEWTRLLRFAKDSWPMRLFQYGQVMIPAGPGHPDYLWVTPFATEGDQSALRFDC
jgi:hypothetical protein